MMRTRFLATATAAAAILIVALFAALPVSAGGDVGTSGLVGRHAVTDSAAQPGAHCGYTDVNGDMVLTSISVRAPVVFARDRTASRDRQQVAWRIQLMGWLPDPQEPWRSVLKLVATGPIHRAPATDATPAAFERDTIAIDTWARGFEVRVKLLWEAAHEPSRVVGTSRHAVDRYAVDGADDPAGWCIAQVY